MSRGESEPLATRRGAAPTSAPPAWREILIGLITFGCYSMVAGLSTAGRAASAERNGRSILRFERSAHIAWEDGLNRWLVPHDVLRVLANYEYAYTYVLSALILLIWLYVRRPDTYRWARTWFLVMNAIAFVCFALYPVTPPRLLRGEGFVDTVTLGHTVGSWGTPLIGHANQLAAMPSLHIAWALWVSVVLACISGAWWVQGISAVHVLLTFAVILATANHYVSDALGAVLLVWLTLGLMAVVRDRPGRFAGPRLAAADAFFLHAESSAAPQHVGGLVLVSDEPDGVPYRERVRAGIEAHLDHLPRFHQQLSPPSRWHRPRWVEAPEIDWDWHVPSFDVSGPDGRPGGIEAVNALIAEIQSTPLPRDRPMWRWLVVTGVGDGLVATVPIVHHAISDGIGTILQVFELIEPPPPLLARSVRMPGRLRRTAGVAVGLAQLATDGGARYRLPSGTTGSRRFGTVALPLATVREVARRHRVRVSDVLLSAAAGAIRRVALPPSTGGNAPDLGTPDDLPPVVRVAVPLMVRKPESSAEGNWTAAVMTNVPLAPMSEVDRLAETARHSGPLHSGTRALASRFVMNTGMAVMPPAAQAWFARTVYGHRYLNAIVSNMPGPTGEFRMAGRLMHAVYPILPLAPGAPLAIGVFGWRGNMCAGICVDPELVDDAGRLAGALHAIIDELAAARPRRDATASAPTGGSATDSAVRHATKASAAKKSAAVRGSAGVGDVASRQRR
ncbi:MAG TPA: phosphatase PAP2 family protein [Micromonosporaceae bacterium]|nr:phosphatase PAP2 family protein [Micromonosporaceae bacterium]